MSYNKKYEHCQADYLVPKIEENLRYKRKHSQMKEYTTINSKILTIKLPPRKVPPIL